MRSGGSPEVALPKTPRRTLTVKEVWRTIVKKNERQGSTRWDVLVCGHSVAANDNTFRKARSCPECRERVQDYVDAQPKAAAAPAARPAPAAAPAAAKSAPVEAPRAAPAARKSRAR
jgi:hypothetical protein